MQCAVNINMLTLKVLLIVITLKSLAFKGKYQYYQCFIQSF